MAVEHWETHAGLPWLEFTTSSGRVIKPLFASPALSFRGPTLRDPNHGFTGGLEFDFEHCRLVGTDANANIRVLDEHLDTGELPSDLSYPSVEIYRAKTLTSLTSPSALTTLNLFKCQEVTSLHGLPSSLLLLCLFECRGIRTLDGVPDSVTDLVESNCSIRVTSMSESCR